MTLSTIVVTLLIFFYKGEKKMLVSGVVVHHKGNVYRLYLPDKTVLADIRFPNTGDTVEEARVPDPWI